MKIIGAVGQNGSGKDEVLKYLKTTYNIPFLSTGDIVREIAAKEKREPTRENLGKISERYFHHFGRGYFVKILAERLKQNDWPIAGISGIRSLDDVMVLRDIFGTDFILIHVFLSNPRMRYERMSYRGEERDPRSYEQFLVQEDNEESLFRIREAEGYADFSLNNDFTLSDLHRQIDKLVRENKLPVA